MCCMTLCFSVVYLSIRARVWQTETFALSVMAGMHGWPSPPLASLSPSSSSSDPAQPPPLCTRLFALTHSDYLLMESLTFWGLFQMSSLQDHILGNIFLSRWGEFAVTALYPPVSSFIRQHFFVLFEEARYITTIVFPWFVPPETTQHASPVFARFSSYSKEKLHELWKVFWVGRHQTDAAAERAFAASKHSHIAFTHCLPHMIICPLLVITHHDDWWNVCEAGLTSSLGLTPRTWRNYPIIKHGSVWRQPKGGLTCQWLVFFCFCFAPPGFQSRQSSSRYVVSKDVTPDRQCSNGCCFIWSVSLFVLGSC